MIDLEPLRCCISCLLPMSGMAIRLDCRFNHGTAVRVINIFFACSESPRRRIGLLLFFLKYTPLHYIIYTPRHIAFQQLPAADGGRKKQSVLSLPIPFFIDLLDSCMFNHLKGLRADVDGVELGVVELR